MGKTRAVLEEEAAEDYALALQDGFRRDWSAYNAILLERFSRTAFMRIKARAWRLAEARWVGGAKP